MIEKMVSEFAHYLNQNHIDIPTSVQTEFVTLIPHMNVKNRGVFQETLKQLWIKDPYDYPKFDACFYEFFFQDMKKIIQKSENDKKRIEIKHLQEKTASETEQTMKNSLDDEWFDQYFEKQTSKASQLLKKVHEKDVHDLIKNVQWSEEVPSSEINDEVENLMWESLCDDQPSIVMDHIHQLNDIVSSLRDEVLKIKNISHDIIKSNEKDAFSGKRKVIKSEIDQLKERKIQSLKQDEIVKLSDYINATSIHFLTRMGKILRSTEKSDEIDLEKTISESLKTFGVPMEMHYRKPKISKTKIDIILDVSGSVIKNAEFLSLFAYLIHKRFPGQVRSFVFVGKLDDVTNYYQVDDAELAVEYSLRKASIDYKGYSNYDEALKIFEQHYLDEVDSNSIILFLGDARNNKNDARVKTVKKIKEKAKSLFWLNPEPKNKWDQGDSVIGKYTPHCNGVYETVTLEQLENALDELTTTLMTI